MQALTYVELEIIWCPLTYGVAPCQAQLGVTGSAKCFNTRSTCQDLANFNLDTLHSPTERADPITLRFTIPTAYLPTDIEAIPSIAEVDFDPATISLGRDLGQRATVTVRFKDHRWSDTGQGFDKYVSERPYNPFTQGSFWGKFRARQPYLRGRKLRVIRGYVGQTLEEMETRHFVVEQYDGPTPDGIYTIVAKDVLKLAAGDRSQAPAISSGFLNADITDTATSLTLSPSGIGAEYPLSGYAAIGGAEIVEFLGIGSPYASDANTLLLVHCDGTDGQTTFTDSSSFARTVNDTGAAQVDTAQSKFGGSASLFDGSGDSLTVPDSNDWTFSGDFTIDFWARHSGAFTNFTALCGHGTNSTNAYGLTVSNLGAIDFIVESGGTHIITFASASGVILADTWHHIALVRSGNVFTIYVDGVSVATTTTATAIPNYTSTFKIGGSDRVTSTQWWLGWIDEFRVSNVARWTANFTPPTAAYVQLSSTDQLAIVRAQFNTDAVSHEAQDRVQVCLQYSAEDPADIIYDLMVTYAGIAASYIDLVAWLNDTGSFLNKVYTALIAEPTPVDKLISELVEQAALVIWWDDIDEQVRLQVLRAISTAAARYTEDNILRDTLEVTEQPDKRISQVWTYFGQINPLGSETDPANYRSTAAEVDTESEDNYGTPAVKKIFSRWIPAFGKAIADRVNAIQIERYKNAPRRFNFELFRYSVDDPLLGRGYRIENRILQDETGATTNAPMQLTRLRPEADRFVIEAEEMLFAAEPEDPTQHAIIIDVDTENIDLEELHDGLYETAISGDTVTVTINAGVVVGSTSISVPAFDVGSWTAGVTVILNVVGRIAGHGGKGDRGSGTAGSPLGGEDGGTALYLRRAISLDCTGGGEIWGGGGGGGGGATGGTFDNPVVGSGGGGGAGRNAGAGGIGGSGPGDSDPGAPGTDTAGGAGGVRNENGGDGGNPGLVGEDGQGQPQAGEGGDPGSAIDGVSFVTVIAAGDVRGPQVN